MRKIGLIFDPHIVSGSDRHVSEGVAVVSEAIDKLNDVGVDWNVIGGDIRHIISPLNGKTDWGGWHGNPDNYYYRDDFRKAKELFDTELEADYYPIRGNNDRPISVYREFFPEEDYPLWFWFEDDGARYVFLDSNPHEGYHTLTEAQNFVSAPQISMLERLMDDDPDIPTFVFIHAPLAEHPEIHEDWNSPTDYAGPGYFLTLNNLTVQRILERGNTVLVNSGHYWYGHGRGSQGINGVEYVLARHLVHNDEPDYGGDMRWMIVDTDEQTATVKYYDVGAQSEGTITEVGW